MDREAESLRRLARMARARNGRLSVNWSSRRLRPRWKMLALDSAWYDRTALRDALRAGKVPDTSRPLTADERRRVANANPWRLYPPTAERAAYLRGGK